MRGDTSKEQAVKDWAHQTTTLLCQGPFAVREGTKQRPDLATCQTLLHIERKSVCGGGFRGYYKGERECTVCICQDHSQTPTLPLAAGECERPMSTSVRFQQSHMALTLAETTKSPFLRLILQRTCADTACPRCTTCRWDTSALFGNSSSTDISLMMSCLL